MFRWSAARVGIVLGFAIAFPTVSAIVEAMGAPDWVGSTAWGLLFLGYFVLMTLQGVRERDAGLLSEGKIAPPRPPVKDHDIS
jgi:hypothetical protein